MKLTRRGAMGAAIGGAAAVAMPDAVGAPAHAPPTQYWGESAKPATDPHWEANHLAKLRRIASGDIHESEKNYPDYGPVEPYEALRSVSPAAKRLFLKDYHARQWRERTIERAKQALAQYDKTGLLQHVL